MSKILYDMETMKFSTLFESMTRSRLKDCFKDEGSIVFVVMPGYMAKAIGKGGVNVKKVSFKIKKEIKIVEFKSNVLEFVKGLVRVPGVEIFEENGIVIKCPNSKIKGQVFGRERENLKWMNTLVSRYFKTEIRVE
ncbi:NusA-like transcription termination signal-binding factor [Candidatus Woesearchaeota archaeon]|mgnify:FL=1|jgi:transcription termination/antitermination protein NusA|nr:NusA-like transcription termination signal-binding factor [Candidatus Woesearchaeota archaeon]MBT3304739.1 NusA-like transcription termination signal-binding factor [Candidatus Woesearchaeota archaeon]MBT4367925.1 NusA-like transcription termination signal-binding factor [Candidatus Woesearchaeota archaeon]MBT4712413.1 NusA-like transcription termination signal-binding factor [Candidatus Woesearchaeota archaeon]MBT6639325.1 NusA-like transcription termination signal-binding factor [Candidatu